MNNIIAQLHRLTTTGLAWGCLAVALSGCTMFEPAPKQKKSNRQTLPQRLPEREGPQTIGEWMKQPQVLHNNN